MFLSFFILGNKIRGSSFLSLILPKSGLPEPIISNNFFDYTFNFIGLPDPKL